MVWLKINHDLGKMVWELGWFEIVHNFRGVVYLWVGRGSSHERPGASLRGIPPLILVSVPLSPACRYGMAMVMHKYSSMTTDCNAINHTLSHVVLIVLLTYVA
jgi:hypothetical protein